VYEQVVWHAATILSHWTGRLVALMLAFGIMILRGISGPILGFSDTWQLFINTGTTIVTS
jgi:low affinity Fe/Cu permease